MFEFLKKALVFVTFLSGNSTYQKYKKMLLEWLSKKLDSKDVDTPNTGEKEMASVYPEKLPVDSVMFLVGGIKDGTIDDVLPDSVYHALQVLEYVVKITIGEPSFVVAMADGPVDLADLAQLSVLEDYEQKFGADKSGIDPATLFMIIQSIVSLLKTLGVFKKKEDQEESVID